jgi:hypothetical protein
LRAPDSAPEKLARYIFATCTKGKEHDAAVLGACIDDFRPDLTERTLPVFSATDFLPSQRTLVARKQDKAL